MNPENLKKKALRTITSPPELVYAVTRHWFAIALCLGIGTAVTLAKVATDSPFYGAQARLLINEQGAAVERGPNGREGDSRRFLQAQVEILKSESVLRTLVRDLGADQVTVQDEGVAKPGEGSLLSSIRGARRQLSDALDSLEFFNPQDVGEERSVQRAIRSLRRRSSIQPDARTGIIDFRLYGHRRETLEKELETWIDAYFHRVNELAKQTYDSFYTSRTAYWKQLEQEDLGRLLEFQEKNPGVSEEQLGALAEDLVRLRVYLSELTIARDSSDLTTPIRTAKAPADDPKRSALENRLLALELQISEARAVYSEESEKIRLLKSKISEITQEIESGGLDDGAEATDPKDRKEKLERQIALVSAQIKERTAEHARLKMLLEEQRDLDSKYRTSKDYREKYSLAFKRSPDFTASDRSVRVTIVDPPSAGTQPVNSSPVGNVFIGSLGGILIGVLIALALEIFTGKIRFKNDVESDLGLPVVGVIQKT